MPPHESATGRRALGLSADWDTKTELLAGVVDLQQVILRVLQVAHLQDPPTDPITRIPRPYEPAPEPKPAQGLDALSEFLKGP